MFGVSETYMVDLEIFKRLGLKTFKTDNSEKLFVGEYKLPHYEKANVKISVSCLPAQFWEFEVETDEDYKYVIRTGSGSLSDYWESAFESCRGMFCHKSHRSFVEYSLNNLIKIKLSMITIKIERDKSCEMARVSDGAGNIMEGNYWDFHNGCHGLYEFDEFNTVSEFAHVLKKFHEERGKEVKIISSEYNCRI